MSKSRYDKALGGVTDAMIELYDATREKMKTDPPSDLPPDGNAHRWAMKNMTKFALVQTLLSSQGLSTDEVRKLVDEAYDEALTVLREVRAGSKESMS